MVGSPQHHTRLEDVRPTAFVARAIGSATGLLVETTAPQYGTAIGSMLAGAIAYWVLSAVSKPAEQIA
jgi:hypothetical protein